tara:strand:+ start:238 stop:522 length:285 start_codon:yes stop_codon:yes gene_type:complete
MYFLKTFLVFLLQYIYSCSFKLLCQSEEIHSEQTRIIFFLANGFAMTDLTSLVLEQKKHFCKSWLFKSSEEIPNEDDSIQKLGDQLFLKKDVSG